MIINIPNLDITPQRTEDIFREAVLQSHIGTEKTKQEFLDQLTPDEYQYLKYVYGKMGEGVTQYWHQWEHEATAVELVRRLDQVGGPTVTQILFDIAEERLNEQSTRGKSTTTNPTTSFTTPTDVPGDSEDSGDEGDLPSIEGGSSTD